MDIFFEIKSKKTQFILSFIAAVIYQLGYEIVITSGSFTVYFLSYIHYEQDWVDMNYGNLMRPVVLLFLAFFAPLSGPMEHFFGPRISMIVSSVILEIGFVSLYFQRNLWLFYSLTFLLGIGIGLSIQLLVKNACHYYPKRKGLISALISSICSLFGSSFAFLGEYAINPERKQLSKDSTFYELEIAERSKLYFLFAMILIPISAIISIFLLYKYDPSCEVDVNIEENVKGPILEGSKEEENTPNKDKPDTRVANSFSKPTSKHNIKKALKHFRFWRNILIVGAMPFMIWFESATSRPYSAMLGVDGKILGILSGTMTILSCITNPILAFCVDKFGFRLTMTIISSLTIALSVYFFFFMDSPIFYVIGLYISSTLRGGIVSSLVPHLMEIFGLRYFLVLGGLGRLFTQLFSFSAACVSIVISIFRKGPKELLLPYRIASLAGAGFGIFGLILVLFETDEKFEFDDENTLDNGSQEKENNSNEEEGK